ncbi:MAG: hypothetical protein IIX31_02535 [Alistipes sp.]|nr:hypothetical protein [Alistipes sp.]MBR0331874.1 hypothetical protein [Alistipes sp.]
MYRRFRNVVGWLVERFRSALSTTGSWAVQHYTEGDLRTGRGLQRSRLRIAISRRKHREEER